MHHEQQKLAVLISVRQSIILEPTTNELVAMPGDSLSAVYEHVYEQTEGKKKKRSGD